MKNLNLMFVISTLSLLTWLAPFSDKLSHTTAFNMVFVAISCTILWGFIAYAKFTNNK